MDMRIRRKARNMAPPETPCAELKSFTPQFEDDRLSSSEDDNRRLD
jgi:hypothetical protein